MILSRHLRGMPVVTERAWDDANRADNRSPVWAEGHHPTRHAGFRPMEAGWAYGGLSGVPG